MSLLDCSHYVRPAGINHQSWTFTAPPDWQRKRLRSLCKVNPSATTKLRTMAGSTEVSFLPMELARAGSPELAPRTAALSDVRNGFTPFIDGDLLIAKITPCFENGKGGIADNLLNGIGFGSTEFHVLRPGPEMDVRFLYYATISEPFREIGVRMMRGSAGQQRVPVEFLNDFVMVFPDIRTQRLIAEFLDRYMRLTGSLIRAKRRQIELLNEQKQVIINSVVTRGLSPDVVLKPSAIDWVPRIPEHWTSVRVRSIASSLQTGPFGSQLHSDEYRPDGVPVINPSHMKGGKICPDQECAVSPAKADQLSRHRLLEGDIVFARRGELGRCALVTEQEVGWICGTGSLRARLADGVAHPAYMLELLLSKGVSEWLSLQSVGSTMENLNTSILARLPLPLPPKSEQHAIAGFVHEQRSLIDTAIRHVTQQIALLREYRTRLIADVVTGKLDVRGVELPHLEDSDIADDLCDSAFDLGTDRDDLPDAEEVEADDED